MFRSQLVVLFLVFLFTINPAYALSVRGCTQKDLVGSWTMLKQGGSLAINTDDQLFYNYQRFVFNNNGTMSHMTQTTPIDTMSIVIQGASPVTTKYSIDQDGKLSIHKQGFANPEVCLCTFLLGDVTGKNLTQKGDIILTYGRIGSQVPDLQRVLRKEVAK